MSWGIVAGAAVSLVGGALSNRSANKGIDRASDAQAQAAREANELQREMWQQGRSDREPFRQSALTANSQLMSLFGLAPVQQSTGLPPTSTGVSTGGELPPSGGSGGGLAGMFRDDGDFRQGGPRQLGHFQQQAVDRGLVPADHFQQMQTGGPGQVQGGPAQSPMDARQAAFDLWRGTPGYQFNLDEGRQQLESSAAARGGLYSGAAAKALTQYGQNYADRTYDDYVRNLQSMAGVAQSVNSQNSQAGMNFANQSGANTINAGNARASGLYQQGQNNAQFTAGAFGALNNGFQNWYQQNQWGGI